MSHDEFKSIQEFLRWVADGKKFYHVTWPNLIRRLEPDGKFSGGYVGPACTNFQDYRKVLPVRKMWLAIRTPSSGSTTVECSHLYYEKPEFFTGDEWFWQQVEVRLPEEEEEEEEEGDC